MSYYDNEIIRLEKELKDVKERRNLYEAAKSQIYIGAKIIDTETGATMVVDKLKNGSNDFEASPVVGGNGGLGRGYFYLVNNWKVIS